ALAKSAFEFGRGTGRLRIRGHREESGLHDQASDLAKVFGLVRRDLHDPICAKSSMKRSEEIFRHKTPRRMAPFRPWIGKQEIKSCDGTRRQQVRNRVGNLEPRDACIR